MNNELRHIKKIYGEEMMHLCRELFPTLLEKEGLLLSTLKRLLAPSRHFAEIVSKRDYQGDFKAWIYNNAIVDEEKRIESSKTPFELMDEAGYNLYECHTERDIQSFRHFYAPREVICTFMGGRLNRCMVFFAVKKNVNDIKREDFPNPERDDEYGTSVISIQFSRDRYCTVSIKNRYNHTVKNPDSTFSNNLENIIPGLTNSFEKHCGITIQNSLNNEEFLTDIWYIQGNDGRYYYCNTSVNGVLYCENNVMIVNNKTVDQYAHNKERYLLIDQYMVDLKEKTIFSPIEGIDDSFINSIHEVGKIKNINIIKSGENRIVCISYEDDKKVEIEINKTNSIIGYKNDYAKEVGDGFMQHNPNIAKISMANVQKIGNSFASTSVAIEQVLLPKVETINNNFLMNAFVLEEISLPEVKRVGNNFISSGHKVKKISLPKIEVIGDHFLHYNRYVEEVMLPEVKRIGSHFLWNDHEIKKIFVPKLESIEPYYSCNISFLISEHFKDLENNNDTEVVRRKPRT